MNKYTCVICGDEQYGWGNNPSPYFSNGKCCSKCDVLFVLPGRLMGYRDITEQLRFMDEISDDIPSDVVKHIEKVNNHLFDEHESRSKMKARDKMMRTALLDELYEEWQDDKVEELRQATLSELEQYNMLQDALSNAIEREYYEAADKIHKRILELEDK